MAQIFITASSDGFGQMAAKTLKGLFQHKAPLETLIFISVYTH